MNLEIHYEFEFRLMLTWPYNAFGPHLSHTDGVQAAIRFHCLKIHCHPRWRRGWRPFPQVEVNGPISFQSAATIVIHCSHYERDAPRYPGISPDCAPRPQLHWLLVLASLSNGLVCQGRQEGPTIPPDVKGSIQVRKYVYVVWCNVESATPPNGVLMKFCACWWP